MSDMTLWDWFGVYALIAMFGPLLQEAGSELRWWSKKLLRFMGVKKRVGGAGSLVWESE